MLISSGGISVLVPYSSLPGFWKFMNRVSPFTYLTGGLLAVGLADAEVVCASNEYLRFTPTAGQTCGQYMTPYISYAGGYLLDPAATDECTFCAIQSTNIFLAQFDILYSDV